MSECRPPVPVTWVEDGVAHIDVRGLPPPQPLVAILRRVGELAPGAPLVVHHNRMPVMLFPELAEIGWDAQPLPAAEGEVRLMLRPLA